MPGRTGARSCWSARPASARAACCRSSRPAGPASSSCRPGPATPASPTPSWRALLRSVLAAHPLELGPGAHRDAGAGAARARRRRRRSPARRSACCCSAPSTPPWPTRSAHGLRALVVDDLHFADEASVEFLQSLAQSETLGALHWGFAQRPAEPGRRRPGAAPGARGGGRGSRPPSCDRSTWRELAALVESIGLVELSAEQLAPALLRHTGGNPMFALETLKDLVLSGRRRRPAAAAGCRSR